MHEVLNKTSQTSEDLAFVTFRHLSKRSRGRGVPPVEEVSFVSAEPHTRNTTGQHLRRILVDLQESY